MPALPDLTARIRVDTSDLEAAVGRAAKSGSAIGSALGTGAANLATAGLSRAVGGITSFASGSVDAFARVEDALGAAGVQFEGGLATVERFANGAAQGFGISKGAALDAANTFGTLGKAAGLQGEPLAAFSTKFAGLAGDLASFKGTSTEQAIEAVGAALRGESEPIRAYGVLLDDASLRQEALAQGLIKTTKEALTPQQKVLATQALILKQTTDAQGDYARTSTSTANTQKTLAAETENAQAALGQKLAPAVTALRGGFLELIRGASGLVDAIGGIAANVQPVVAAFAQGLQPALAAVVPAVQAFIAAIPQPVLTALGVVLGVIAAAIVTQTAATAAAALATGAWAAVTGPFIATKNAEGAVIARGTVARLAHNVATIASTAATVAWSVATKAAAVAMRVLNAVLRANPIGLVITALTLLVGGLILAYRNSETFRAVVQAAFEKVKAAGAALGAFFTTTIPAAFAAVKARVGAIVQAMQAALSSAWAAIKSAVAAAFGAVKLVVTTIFDGIKAYVTTVLGVYRAIFTAALGAIKAVFTTVFGAIKAVVTGFLTNVQQGFTIALGAVRGVVGGALGAITGAFSAGMGAALGAVRGGLGQLSGIASGALGAMRGAVSAGIDGVIGLARGVAGRVTGAFGNFGSLLSGAGRALMQGLADGVRATGQKVVDAAKAVVQKVKNLLPGSPIKDGPLKSWNRGGAGRRLMGTLEQGIRAGGPGVQGALAQQLSGLDVGALGASTGRTLAAGQALPAAPAASAAAAGEQLHSLVGSLAAELAALREDVRRLPGEYVQRQRTGQVAV